MPPPSAARRLDRALALSPPARPRIFEAFFSAYPGSDRATLGLGRALAEFLAWEEASGRLSASTGSPWWRSLNGWMALDIACANREACTCAGDGLDGCGSAAWRTYAEGSTSGDGVARQRLLWAAHQGSLEAAVRAGEGLLDVEPATERTFIAIVLANVSQAAALGTPTDDATLGTLCRRWYPLGYPAEAQRIRRLGARDRTRARR